MARQRGLSYAWAVLALASASCVSPEELRREDEGRVLVMATAPALERP
jgi:hypothetical protein